MKKSCVFFAMLASLLTSTPPAAQATLFVGSDDASYNGVTADLMAISDVHSLEKDYGKALIGGVGIWYYATLCSGRTQGDESQNFILAANVLAREDWQDSRYQAALEMAGYMAQLNLGQANEGSCGIARRLHHEFGSEIGTLLR